MEVYWLVMVAQVISSTTSQCHPRWQFPSALGI